jgi:hypothetical protein
MWEISAHKMNGFAGRTIEKLRFDYGNVNIHILRGAVKKYPELFGMDGLVHNVFVKLEENVTGNVFVQVLQRLREAVGRSGATNGSVSGFCIR